MGEGKLRPSHFVILGYVIRFYPQQLTGFDSTIQSAIRGDLPATLTAFFTKVTHVMDTKIIVIWVGLLLAVLAYKKWYSEALFLGSNLVLTGLFGSSSKEYLPETETKYSSSSRGKGFSSRVVIHWRLPLFWEV